MRSGVFAERKEGKGKEEEFKKMGPKGESNRCDRFEPLCLVLGLCKIAS